MALKSIAVAAAVIVHEGRILATQRGSGELKGGWEFPGGKLEQGETGEMAIVREIVEELAMHIEPLTCFTTVEHDYPSFHLSMACFLSRMREGEEPVLLEHSAAKWITVEDLDKLAWCPADQKVAQALKLAWPELSARFAL